MPVAYAGFADGKWTLCHQGDDVNKTVQLALRNYAAVPPTLCAADSINVARAEIEVPLASLYHHYYLDTYGQAPPSPDPAHFEHLRFLLPCNEFRFQGAGLGISPTSKRNRSNELGQAFCRWFLNDHLNISYFAHMGDVLSRQSQRPFVNCTVRRTNSGDTPDYLCAEDRSSLYLAEAKGRYSSVSFGTSEFQSWRRQFDRVEVVDPSGNACSLKGHIVATRLATEVDAPSVRTKLLAEDPSSPGDRPLSREAAEELGNAIIGLHYASIAQKLNQPLLAAALAAGLPLPEQILIQAVVWRLAIDPNKHRRFVGGYYTGPSGAPAFGERDGEIIPFSQDPFRLDVHRGTFVGLDESVFYALIAAARKTGRFETAPPQSEDTIDSIYSAVSMLRDGSAIGPADLFVPVDAPTF
jgi:hypothetical protein